jgi:hypothetical protein
VRIAAGQLDLSGGTIDTAAQEGAGGNIDLRVSGPAAMVASAITASVGSGSGGNVTVEAPLLVLDGSRIVAQADDGAGGNIVVRTDLLLASPDSEISASARLGVDGTVAIEAPDVDLAGTLVALPETPLAAADLLRERCASVRSDEVGSFVVRGRAGAPASYAEGLLLALVPTAAAPTGTAQASDFVRVARADATPAAWPGCPTATR